MYKNKTVIENSKTSNSSDETTIINSLTNYQQNEADVLSNKSVISNLVYQNDPLSMNGPNAKNVPLNYDELDLNDIDTEANHEKKYTLLETIKFPNQDIEGLNISTGSDDFEELVDLKEIKNIEELESFEESKDFEESINLEEIKNIENTKTLEVSQNLDESVNFKDIKNIDGSVIIELDNVKLSPIGNDSQEWPYFLIEIPSQKLENENPNTAFTSSQSSEITSESQNDHYSSNFSLQPSSDQSYDNLRQEVEKQKREMTIEIDEIKIENHGSEVSNQEAKVINDDLSQTEFVRPITPDKLHKTKKLCIDKNSDEHNILLSSPILSGMRNNLTDEEKTKFNTSQDIMSNSDNEFEQICNFIKNDNYDPAQLSIDTLVLLDEFNEIDQSTNEQLLADLIRSPVNVHDQSQEEYNRASPRDIEQDIEGSYEIYPKNEEMEFQEFCMLAEIEEQKKSDNSENQSENEREEVSVSHHDDDPSNDDEDNNDEENDPDYCYDEDNDPDNCYDEDNDPDYHNDEDNHDNENHYPSYQDKDDDSDDDGIEESSSDIDIEELRRKAKKAKKSLVIKKEIREKLANFTVKLKHEVPPQHKLEKTLVILPGRRTELLFEKYAPLRKGYFISSEDEIIKENWKYFCKVHDWDPADVRPFLQSKYKGKSIMKQEEAINFARFMARGLPSRPLYSVIGRFRRLFREHARKLSRCVRRSYTTKEDKIIMAYLQDDEIDRYGGIKKLAKLLDRPIHSVNYRLGILRTRNKREKFLFKKNIRQSVDWDIPLAEKFLKNLIELTLSDDVEELKDAIIPIVVWIKLEKRMKISISCLKSFWLNKLHAQLFYERPLFIYDIKVLLIEYMYVKGISDREEIDWSEIGELFDGIPIGFLMSMFYNMERYCNTRIHSNLEGAIDWLYKNRINQLKLSRKERYLPGIIYKDGKIEVIHRSYPTEQDCDRNNSSEDVC